MKYIVINRHLGYFKEAYTPTFRGFKSFLGIYGWGADYFKHLASPINNTVYYDLRRDSSPNCGKNCSKVASDANEVKLTKKSFFLKKIDLFHYGIFI